MRQFTETLPNQVALEMITVPTKTFAIGKYPITQEQYKEVMGVNPSHFQGNPRNPVESVSYDDAVAFCEKLSEMIGKNYRLPTESEWEYACRAGTVTGYYFGDDFNQLGDYAWYYKNSQGTTHPVGLKLPNAWGLHDMIGNVWELCQEGVIRGGSWGSYPSDCRSAFCINYYHCDYRDSFNGFRVVCDRWHSGVKILAEEMWEAGLPEPYRIMDLSKMVEYLEALQTKKEKKKFLTAVYWSGFQAGLETDS